MTYNVILAGIKEATKNINSNYNFLMDHMTDQLFYLDEIIKNLGCEGVVLIEETYSNILLLEFETVLLMESIKFNCSNIEIDIDKLHIINENCKDILDKTGKIREYNRRNFNRADPETLKKIANNVADKHIAGGN